MIKKTVQFKNTQFKFTNEPKIHLGFSWYSVQFNQCPKETTQKSPPYLDVEQTVSIV